MNSRFDLNLLLQSTHGQLLQQSQSTFNGVGTDTRKDLHGQIFFALKGDAFDAHNFLDQAVKAGAAAVVAHSREALLRLNNPSVSLILVADTLRALQDFAQAYRKTLSCKVLAVTGTNGKTTTKEFTASILSPYLQTQYSKGSFNNHWGVPLSLLAVDKKHQVAMIEMGMNHIGELKPLMAIADPDVVGCTMVGRGHLEGMGSIEGVARGKAEIYECARDDAAFIFNRDNLYTEAMLQRATKGHRLFRFSSNPHTDAEIHFHVLKANAEDLEIEGDICGEVGHARIPVFGAHNVVNLMAASAFALASGLQPAQIWQALPHCRTIWGRNQWVDLKSGARLLFDAYNANPESMQAAIHNFGQLQLASGQKKYAVLGEMRELGEHAENAHFELGQTAADGQFAQILFFAPGDAGNGDAFRRGMELKGKGKSVIVANSYENKLAEEMASVLSPGDCVLLKGSRGVQLELAMQKFAPLNFALKT